MTQRRIYFFGNHQADGSSEIKHLIGGKGASLADMTRAGLNVPPGFTISAECCAYVHEHQRWPDGLEADVHASLSRLEQLADRVFGAGASPLLLAVRSGAEQSMPGMMDTLLNVGLNPDCVRAMAERTGNHHGAWEAYLHFIRMFSNTTQPTAGGKTPADPDVSDANPETLCKQACERHRVRTGRDFPTDPWTQLRTAIDAVFASWMSPRAITYRKHHKLDSATGTAVNVQMMCPSEVSGVMFTANPVSQAGEIIIESAFGLGEAIVLGKVTPDRFVLDKASLAVKERTISRKDTRVATLAEDGVGQTGGKDDPSLTESQVAELATLGMQVEKHFKVPCDIEWALSRGTFFLLQTRAIKFKAAGNSVDPVLREKVRSEEIAALKTNAEPGGTVWSRFNLAEILPEPTPMTWGIVKQFMSGHGGFGRMYRDLGFSPDPALDDVGMFDLICGRPYCNLSHEPRMQFDYLPMEHNFAFLKKNPSKAIYPQAMLNPRRAGMGFFLKLPILFIKMWWSQVKQQQAIRTFAEQFAGTVLPPYLAEVDRAWREDWVKLPTADVLGKLNYWIQFTLFDFARHSLKPTALAALLLAELERAFAMRLRPHDVVKPAEAMAAGVLKAQAALRELVVGVHPDEESDLPAAIRALRDRRLSRPEFLRRFGHRGSQEMELASPRWSEDATAIDGFLGGSPTPAASVADLAESSHIAWLKLADEAKLMPQQRPAVEAELRRLQTYMALRETAKHHLLRGYALIRRALLELDRRYQLAGGIFYLTPDDLPNLVNLPEGKAPADYFDRIETARTRRTIALSIEAPTVIFSDDLDAIGRAPKVQAGGAMQGIPLSAGVVEANAWVLEHAEGAAVPHEPYILVCPSTDPAWVPLFVQARGLVMETGGMLSHGAIVAREFALPAVAGIPDVHRRIKTGQRIRIDGATGTVNVVD